MRLNKTDSRLANNGLPLAMQKLRCHVNYHALRFTPRIEELGRRLVQILRGRGPFLVLHLRYEMDMLAFSGCTHGCTDEEADQLTKMRLDIARQHFLGCSCGRAFFPLTGLKQIWYPVMLLNRSNLA